MKKYVLFLAGVATFTVLTGLIYGVSQQVLRMSANDPQIQIAEDTAVSLDKGTSPDVVVGELPKIDMARSLAPFTIIYDKSGHVVAGSGIIAGKVPEVPVGVLRSSERKSYNAVTWQPAGGVRIASIETSTRNYYVLSGRSLTEVERRINDLGKICLMGWVVLIGILISTVMIRSSWKLQSRRSS